MKRETMAQEETFVKAYDSYADAILRYCYFRVYDREQARDLVQETFMRTWEYLARGEEVKNIRAFLYRVATNLIIDGVRKKKELSLDELKERGFDAGFSPQQQLENQVDVKILLELINKIDEKYQQAVILRYVNDLPPEEIAEITGESPNNVSVRIHRGIKQIKKLLAQQ